MSRWEKESFRRQKAFDKINYAMCADDEKYKFIDSTSLISRDYYAWLEQEKKRFQAYKRHNSLPIGG